MHRDHQAGAAGNVVEHRLNRGVGKNASVRVELVADPDRRECRRQRARCHNMAKVERHVPAVKILHFAGAHVGGPARRAIAEKFGMTDFVNPKDVEGDLVPYIVNLTKGGADYSFECVGNPTLMRQALECSHRGWGKSIIIGVAGAGQEISTRPLQLVTGRTWMGTAFGGARGRTDVPRIVDWYMDGRINIDDLITHVLPFEQINDGFELMRRGESIRSVVVY